MGMREETEIEWHEEGRYEHENAQTTTYESIERGKHECCH
jgi:hypothetical protein